MKKEKKQFVWKRHPRRPRAFGRKGEMERGTSLAPDAPHQSPTGCSGEQSGTDGGEIEGMVQYCAQEFMEELKSLGDPSSMSETEQKFYCMKHFLLRVVHHHAVRKRKAAELEAMAPELEGMVIEPEAMAPELEGMVLEPEAMAPEVEQIQLEGVVIESEPTAIEPEEMAPGAGMIPLNDEMEIVDDLIDFGLFDESESVKLPEDADTALEEWFEFEFSAASSHGEAGEGPPCSEAETPNPGEFLRKWLLKGERWVPTDASSKEEAYSIWQVDEVHDPRVKGIKSVCISLTMPFRVVLDTPLATDIQFPPLEAILMYLQSIKTLDHLPQGLKEALQKQKTSRSSLRILNQPLFWLFFGIGADPETGKCSLPLTDSDAPSDMCGRWERHLQRIRTNFDKLKMSEEDFRSAKSLNTEIAHILEYVFLAHCLLKALRVMKENPTPGSDTAYESQCSDLISNHVGEGDSSIESRIYNSVVECENDKQEKKLWEDTLGLYREKRGDQQRSKFKSWLKEHFSAFYDRWELDKCNIFSICKVSRWMSSLYVVLALGLHEGIFQSMKKVEIQLFGKLPQAADMMFHNKNFTLPLSSEVGTGPHGTYCRTVFKLRCS